MEITVCIPHDVSERTEARIKSLLEREELCNPNFNGADLSLERDHSLWIDAEGYHDQGAIMRLLREVQSIVWGHEENV